MKIVVTSGDLVSIDAAIRDQILAELLAAEADPDDRASLFADVCEIGARVLVRHRDGEQADLLRREVERWRDLISQSQQELVAVAGADFAQAVTQVVVEVSHQLSNISGRLDGVLAVGEAQQRLQTERERGTAKGRSFEERVAEEVDSVARHCGDSCEHVGDVGSIAGRVGDVLVGVGGAQGVSSGKIVFEAKSSKLSRPEAIRELDRALESRGADYAVLVVDGAERVPAKVHELLEIGGDKIVVALDDNWSRRGVEVAYSLARARVLARREERSGVDVSQAQTHIERAQSYVDDARSLKLKLTGVVRAAEEAREQADAVLDRVKSSLASAQRFLES